MDQQEDDKLLEEMGSLGDNLQPLESVAGNKKFSPMNMHKQQTHRHLNDNAKEAIEDAPMIEEKKQKQPDHEFVVVKEIAENFLGIRAKFLVHFIVLKFMDLDLSYSFSLCERVLS